MQMALDPVAEEYIKTVYQLERELSRRVRTVEIAEAVERTQASVSHMIQKLDEEGLVDYREYKGVRATDSGTEIALRVIRKHRLIETFLADQLNTPWAEVHEEADRLEHHISDEFADRLAAFLGNPRTDPHGDPIPNKELNLQTDQDRVGLTDCTAGDTFIVEQVPHHQPDVRKYLFENDIDPGTTVVIDDIASVGLVTLTVEETEQRVSIPDHIARQIKVRCKIEPLRNKN